MRNETRCQIPWAMNINARLIRLAHFQRTLSLGKPAASVSRNIGDIVMEKISGNALLNWDVFVTPGLPIVARDLPRGVRDANFQAMAATLILWQAGRRPGGYLYDGQAGQCSGRLDCSKR